MPIAALPSLNCASAGQGCPAPAQFVCASKAISRGGTRPAGMMRRLARSEASSGSGTRVVMTTRTGASATTPVRRRTVEEKLSATSPSLLRMRQKEKTTSRAVKGWPLWKRTPGQRVNSQVRSSRRDQLSASEGCAFSRASRSTRLSKTWSCRVEFGAAAYCCGSAAVGSAAIAMRRVCAGTGAVARSNPRVAARRRMGSGPFLSAVARPRAWHGRSSTRVQWLLGCRHPVRPRQTSWRAHHHRCGEDRVTDSLRPSGRNAQGQGR